MQIAHSGCLLPRAGQWGVELCKPEEAAEAAAALLVAPLPPSPATRRRL